ncbi:MAG: ATP-binding protein [Formivibrio sp.]|nr:ATP-binding protein [Formivibrio sp.]
MKFNRIGIKVFLILAVLNASLILAVYLFNLWRYDHDLSLHIEKQQKQLLLRLAHRLAEGFEQQGGWANIVHSPAVVDALIFDTLFDDSTSPELSTLPELPAFSSEKNGGLPMGILLLGASGERLLGEERWSANTVSIPIQVQNRTVGYLEASINPPFSLAILQAFVEQQRQSFVLLAMGMLVVSALGAFVISRRLGRPIDDMTKGARALARGDCSVQLAGDSQDELGQLVGEFNGLAQTLAANRERRREWLINITQELRTPLSVMLVEIEAMRGWVVDIAHELRTPLTVILGEIEAVEDGIHQYDAAWLHHIGQKTRQLSLLVNDLHQLALSDQGALVFHKAPVDLGCLVQEYLDSYQLTFEHVGLHVDIILGKNLPVLGDADRLRQLLGNFLQNTLRYTDVPGSLRIRVSLEHGKVILIWEDSAPGVPEAVLDRLTERLYRGDDSRSRATGGSGLGLAIAKAIVDAHDGIMQASLSDLGGLCWTLQLPLVPELEYA